MTLEVDPDLSSPYPDLISHPPSLSRMSLSLSLFYCLPCFYTTAKSGRAILNSLICLVAHGKKHSQKIKECVMGFASSEVVSFCFVFNCAFKYCVCQFLRLLMFRIGGVFVSFSNVTCQRYFAFSFLHFYISCHFFFPCHCHFISSLIFFIYKCITLVCYMIRV